MGIGSKIAYGFSGLLFAFAGFIAMLAEPAKQAETVEPAPRACRADDNMPGIMSRRFVEKQLRSPSTAEFPWTPVNVAYVDTCTWQVFSYVDAQNGFGATVRTPYLITMVYDPGTDRWHGRDLQM